ncbi:MAG: NAD(P)H-dependent oxidoreductase [Cyanobacteria bacterium Co-bin13]|nr:NAD(P)H-dependent oxidoreductase [Cyanobacteria bacterium Co-bin13]
MAMITYRDLRQTPIPHVTEDWIAADFTPPEALTSEMAELLKFSDELVDELLAADRCVFSVPMYNFSLLSNFKAYVDQVVRVGRTFTFEDGQFKGLASGRKVLFITSARDRTAFLWIAVWVLWRVVRLTRAIALISQL